MDARTLVRSFSLGVALLLVSAGTATAQPQPGECASGFCGTPKNNGGGGCGCGGGSILVNNTDIGQTYSTSDDYDADGLEDDFDNCPFVNNRDQADKDGDKVGDVCDNCAAIGNPDQRDVNLDSEGDACDADIDGDTVLNAADNCPSVPNVLKKDTDGDGLGDVCDVDMDGDGVTNSVDNCPLVPNADQAKDAPGRYGAACDVDSDKDTIDDSKDNCPGAYNPDQIDTDADTWGNACDTDIDNDQIVNASDNCPMVSNPQVNGRQPDGDQDGVGDVCQTHGFCFVAAPNATAKCLDPQSVFSVTAAPAVPADHPATTGKDLWPTIFSNRPGSSIRYSWAITQQPEGANITITRPRGTVSDMVDASSYGYTYSSAGDRPVFTPTHPGTYKLNLAADLVAPDSKFPGFVHAESEIEINVSGPITNTGGCGMSGRAAAGSSFACAGLLLAVGALVRRRRRA